MRDMPRVPANETAPHPRPIGPLFANRGAALGALLLFAIWGYRRICHPDWSGAQALAFLWPVYVVGVLPILVRWALAQPWGSRTLEWAGAARSRAVAPLPAPVSSQCRPKRMRPSAFRSRRTGADAERT